MKNNIKAIIFDMDGVLVDSQSAHIKAERAACEKYGLFVPMSEWKNFYGWKIEEIFAFLKKKYKKSDLPIDKMVNFKKREFKKYNREIIAISGSLEFLKFCRKNFSKIALATSTKIVMQKLIFNKYGFYKYFDKITTGDMVKRGKPSPDIYKLAIKKIELKPKECIVIEDAPNGIIAAKKAGCIALGITTSFSRRKLLAAKADHVGKDFFELKDYIKKII